MYQDLIKFPLEHENLQWDAREALLDVGRRPHLFLRIRLKGTAFPMMAQVPQVWAGKARAKPVLIAEDRQSVRAYFDVYPEEGSVIYFGHMGKAELSFGPFHRARMAKLDRTRLPKDIVLPEKD